MAFNLKTILSIGRTAITLLASFSQDVVAISDPKSGARLFPKAQLMKCNVSRASKLMDHPLENGSPVTDYKIILPVEIDMGILINSYEKQATYDFIAYAFGTSQFMTVQTNAGVFTNMVVQAMPHDEGPDMWGMLVMSLRLREVQLVTVQFQDLTPADVAKPTDQSTVKSGQKSPTAIPKQNSAAYDLFFSPARGGL